MNHFFPCEYCDPFAYFVVSICFSISNARLVQIQMMTFTIWSNASRIMAAATNSAWMLLYRMYALQHIICAIMTSEFSICADMYMGRHGAHMAAPYMRPGLTMVSNTILRYRALGSVLCDTARTLPVLT